MRQKRVKSFGVIPIYKDKEDFYILLVKNSKGGHWGLPKGTPEVGEEPIETAKRELLEETGIKDIDVRAEVAFKEKYNFEMSETLYHKTNTYFPGFVDEMTVGTRLDGIDEVRWVKIDEAKNTLTHKPSIDLVREVSEWLTQTTNSEH